MRLVLLFAMIWFFGAQAFAQSKIIFSKAQHDFGNIAPDSRPIEQDFLFRNTHTSSAIVASIISSSRFLEAIHTRSSVHPGEYGFVKIKLRTDSLHGLFNEFVEVEIKTAEATYSERIYVRAEVNKHGNAAPERSFTDSEIALTVEVSPDDVADMEGFLGEDKLARAETEITYLRRQMKLQSALLFRFNEDLKAKQLSEEENLQQLADLEKGIRENSADEAILSQIDLLSERLLAIQKSDQELRKEFSSQEAEYVRLKYEADSARSYAEQLSRDLSARFKAEAAAIERANELEHKLESRQLAEQRQLAKIDSLNQVIKNSGSKDDGQLRELTALRNTLASKEREQALQKKQAEQQRQRLEQLQMEQSALKNRGDSLAASVEEQGATNRTLQQKLAGTEKRIVDYKATIDSLESSASNASEATREAQELRKKLIALENQDDTLQRQITSQQQEIVNLEMDKEKTTRDLRALESATSRQLEETHKLMHRINGLSTKESEARLEAMKLRKDLAEAKSREAEAEQETTQLRASLTEREGSIHEMESTLSDKMQQVEKLKREHSTLTLELTNTAEEVSKIRGENDSLNLALSQRESNLLELNNEIVSLQNALERATESQAESAEKTQQLTNDLAEVRLNNEMTFEEMRVELANLSKDRDVYREQLNECQSEVRQMEVKLKAAQQREAAAIAFAQEFQTQKPSSDEIIFRVYVLTSSKKIESNQVFKNLNDLHEFEEENRFHYAAGKFTEIEAAQHYQKQLQRMGFGMAKVIAFKGAQKISMDEALETALK